MVFMVNLSYFENIKPIQVTQWDVSPRIFQSKQMLIFLNYSGKVVLLSSTEMNDLCCHACTPLPQRPRPQIPITTLQLSVYTLRFPLPVFYMKKIAANNLLLDATQLPIATSFFIYLYILCRVRGLSNFEIANGILNNQMHSENGESNPGVCVYEVC